MWSTSGVAPESTRVIINCARSHSTHEIKESPKESLPIQPPHIMTMFIMMNICTEAILTSHNRIKVFEMEKIDFSHHIVAFVK